VTMTTLLLRVGRVFTPTAEIADAGILIREGVIEAVGPRSGMTAPADAQEITAKDRIAIPGFVDVHIHGAGGRDVMEGTTDAMNVVAETVAKHGTTSLVATTVTASSEDTIRSVQGIAKLLPYSMKRKNPEPRFWESISKDPSSVQYAVVYIRLKI